MTTYEEIYNRFLSKIEDYNILQEMQQDADFVKSMLLDYLTSAISKYTYQVQDFSQRDDEAETFYITLTDLEIEILSMLMVVEYLTPKIVRTEMIEQRLTSKDLREFSPANLMKEIRTIKDEMYSKAHGLMVENYLRSGI